MSLNYDRVCLKAITRSPAMLVPWYLMAAYLYYHRDESIVSDAVYDSICKRLAAEWDAVTHPHKQVIRRDELSAGTCLRAADEFPIMARSAACRLARLPLP